MPPQNETDDQLAARLAGEAGRLLLSVRAEVGFAAHRTLKDAGDQRSQAFLGPALAGARPGDAVLSEEAPDDPARLRAERVWIVDPLDGTREFGEEGRTDWAVHVALWAREATGPAGELVVGAVALPAREIVLWTGGPLPPPAPYEGPPRVVASRTRAPAVVSQVAAAIGGQVVPLGSAGAKIAAVVLGEAEAYVHAGGQYEWDSAAPVAVARAAGLYAARLDGSPLRYNRPDVYVPDLVVCHPDLAGSVRAALAGAGYPQV